jgi:hypothetical protein
MILSFDSLAGVFVANGFGQSLDGPSPLPCGALWHELKYCRLNLHYSSAGEASLPHRSVPPLQLIQAPETSSS